MPPIEQEVRAAPSLFFDTFDIYRGCDTFWARYFRGRDPNTALRQDRAA